MSEQRTSVHSSSANRADANDGSQEASPEPSKVPGPPASASVDTLIGLRSRASTAKPCATGTEYRPNPLGPPYFKSRLIDKATYEKPFFVVQQTREKWSNIFPIIGLVIGLIMAAFLIWHGVHGITNHKYCEVMYENFANGFNDQIWTKEMEAGGFGKGRFEMSTNSDENVFVRDGILHIKPTLQDSQLVENDNIIDLRDQGCTGLVWTDCVTSTNTTNGTIIQPIKSGRINTKIGGWVKHGRVEVFAKLPSGDWLRPSIKLIPKDNVYGEWPKSGEIDIMMSRGNSKSYELGGDDIISSALHFGPDSKNDGWWRNIVKRRALHTTYADGYHKFGVEWTDKYIFTYIDTRLLQVLYTQFTHPFFTYGHFPLSDDNGSRILNPWVQTGSNASPFDQDFYLVIDVGVGGTDGWFEDHKGGKPWLDRSPDAKRDFWEAREEWAPGWERGGWMEVRSVRMWQQVGFNGCEKGEAS